MIKTVGGDQHAAELKRLRAAAGARANVHVRDGYVTREEHQALVAACDAFVSLHRAEGYGLHLAEAMAHGKPVVATGYSGNLEFMDDTNSRLVPFTLVPIPDGCEPYPAGARWARTGHRCRGVRDARDRRRSGDRSNARRSGPRPTSRGCTHRRSVDASSPISSAGCRTRVFVEQGIEDVPSHEPPGEDVLTLEALFAQVRAGAGLGSPTRLVRLSRRVRSLMSRLTQHTADHQRRIDLAITHNINHLVTETSDLPEIRKLIEELTTRIRELDARLIKERDYRRELTEDLRDLAQGDGPPTEG